MPVLRGAITFCRFRAESIGDRPKDVKRWLSRGFRARAFEPIDPSTDTDRSAGWVEIEDTEKTELAPQSFLHGEYVLVTWRIDRLRVPASIVKSELDAWSKKFEKDK